MYGRIFEQLYTGSMIGAGCPVFAVWGYVIANMRADMEVGAQVELNPQLLGYILGAKEPEIQKAIDYLCAPDPRSRSKAEDGRRLIRLGQFAYQVVNGAKYLAVRNAEQKRASDRLRKQKERQLKRGKPLPGEMAATAAAERGDQNGADAITAAALPEALPEAAPRGTFPRPKRNPAPLQPAADLPGPPAPCPEPRSASAATPPASPSSAADTPDPDQGLPASTPIPPAPEPPPDAVFPEELE